MTSPARTRPAQRGPYAKGRTRRDEIISAALDALSENGHLNAALDEVARRVGISRQGVLHYFGSREDLLIAVLQERDRRDVEVGAREYRMGEPPADAIERAILGTWQ